MTDRYENIREALAMGPTPGPWELKDGRTDTVENAQGYPVCTVHWYPDERYGHGTRAAYIAACDPDTIRELLAERDQLAAALEAVRRNAGVLVPPEGYALVSVEMLRIWGKLDEVRECCRYLKHATPQPAHVDDEALRAAAPELLAALKKVAQALEWFAHGRCRGFDDEAPLPTSEAVELAKRTIAKALGHDDSATAA